MASGAKNRKWLGYILYVILVTLMLLYYLFPAEAVEKTLDSGIGRINPALGFQAKEIRLWLPAGLKIDGAQVSMQDGAVTPVFQADSLHIRPRILDAMGGNYGFDLSGRAYSGDMTGSFDSGGENGDLPAGEITFRDFDLAAYEPLAEIFRHTLTGKVSGTIVYGEGSGPGAAEKGRAALRLAHGQLELQAPVFGISAVDLLSVELDLTLRKREITVSRVELTGPEVKASLAGSIQLQTNIMFSQLNLKGSLEPLAEFYKNHPEIREMLKSMRKRAKRGQYSFTITGTLGEPRFRLL